MRTGGIGPLVAGHEVREVYDVDPATCNYCLGSWASAFFYDAFYLVAPGMSVMPSSSINTNGNDNGQVINLDRTILPPLPHLLQHYNPLPNARYNPHYDLT
jgi:hypothetical protein